MALFGVPEPNPWQTIDAVNATLSMRSALEKYNNSLTSQGLPPLSIGIGVHRGYVVAGVIGSNELVEYTVIGDTVNLTSRIESLTRIHKVDILITDAIRTQLGNQFQLKEMPPVIVKGKSEPIITYAVEKKV
jgi:adenylate cyclase